jgi:hypothetical protein
MNEIKRIFLIKWDNDDKDENNYVYLNGLTKRLYQSKLSRPAN